MITQTHTFKYNPIPNIAPYVRDAIDRIMGNISKEEYVQLADFLNGVQNDIVGYNHEHDDVERRIDNHPDISDFEKIFIIIGHGCMMSYDYYLAVQEKKVV